MNTGFEFPARSLGDIIGILKGDHPNPGGLRDYCLIFRSNLMAELESTLFLAVQYSAARFYREPRRDWQEVVARFPEAIGAIDEPIGVGKCAANNGRASGPCNREITTEHRGSRYWLPCNSLTN
jgi:hypothetical protein